MSKFTCEVVPITLREHPDAITLSIVKVWGYTVVVKTADWIDKQIGVYIPPDSVVPCDKRFEFLFSEKEIAESKRIPTPKESIETPPEDPNKPITKRVTVRRFRGVYSQGLLMPVDKGDMDDFDGFMEGILSVDFASDWGITHYEPQIKFHTGGECEAGPPGLVVSKYDVENFNRYGDCIPEGTLVYITEKVHGCNARYVWANDRMYIGSRTRWKKDNEFDPWNRCLKQNPWIDDWCRAHPEEILYGEVFGQVQDLTYGAENGELFFRAFDVLCKGMWVNYDKLVQLVPAEHRVPLRWLGAFNETVARGLAEQDSLVCPGQLAEGVVICPLMEMTNWKIGRVQLKIVSNRYFDRKKRKRG